MSADQVFESGRSGAREVPVWDPLVRLVHWSVALIVLMNAVVTNPEGPLHRWLGYIAVLLVAARLVWGVIGPRLARFSAFPPQPGAALRHLRHLARADKTAHLSHNPLGALMVYNLWATLVALGMTGHMLGMLQFFGLKWVEAAHEMAFNWLMISVALHLGGVIFDTRRTGVPLVRAMLTGRKRLPQGLSVE